MNMNNEPVNVYYKTTGLSSVEFEFPVNQFSFMPFDIMLTKGALIE